MAVDKMTCVDCGSTDWAEWVLVPGNYWKPGHAVAYLHGVTGVEVAMCEDCRRKPEWRWRGTGQWEIGTYTADYITAGTHQCFTVDPEGIYVGRWQDESWALQEIYQETNGVQGRKMLFLD